MNKLFRTLPSVDICLTHLFEQDSFFATQPRGLIKEAINAFLQNLRTEIQKGRITEAEKLALPAISKALCAFVREKIRPNYQKVINGTGVVIHTNMGRSVLAKEAIEAIVSACSAYSNLELDLASGERGSRYSHLTSLLCKLTGAEEALVVNNNAAAVLLVLDALCKGGEVVVARGQLVEIGGAFRIPEVMERSGATLREIGCTNRVHLADYAQAINEETKALMRVHTSNFRVIGFHSDVDIEPLAALAKEHEIPLIEDLGSGSLVDLPVPGLIQEPTVQSVVKAGADVVTFSGDKVLGGPQAGIIVGKKAYIDRIKKSPLLRALRIDKMTVAALEATLRLYVDKELADERVPTLRMIKADAKTLQAFAQKLARAFRRAFQKAYGDKAKDMVDISCVAGLSQVGGGAFPECNLPTSLVAIKLASCSPNTLRKRLLLTNPPLIGRVENEAFCVDARSLLDEDLALVASVFVEAAGAK